MDTFKLALTIFAAIIILPIIIFLMVIVFGASGWVGLLFAAMALFAAYSE